MKLTLEAFWRFNMFGYDELNTCRFLELQNLRVRWAWHLTLLEASISLGATTMTLDVLELQYLWVRRTWQLTLIFLYYELDTWHFLKPQYLWERPTWHLTFIFGAMNMTLDASWRFSIFGSGELDTWRLSLGRWTWNLKLLGDSISFSVANMTFDVYLWVRWTWHLQLRIFCASIWFFSTKQNR